MFYVDAIVKSGEKQLFLIAVSHSIKMDYCGLRYR